MDRKDSKKDMHGEGNPEADKRYRDGAGEFAKRPEDVERGAKEAERALDTEREDLDRASERGRKPSAGDSEKDLRKAGKNN